MGTTHYLKRCIRRLVTLIPPLRPLLHQVQSRLSRSTNFEDPSGDNAVISSLEPLMHRPFCTLEASPGISTGEMCNDAGMIDRVLRAYKASAAVAASVTPSAMWKTIFAERQLPIHKTILGGDVKAVTTLLRRPGDSNLFWGFDGLVSQYVKSYNSSSAISMYCAKLCKDHLLRVAEDVGALRYENPEAPDSMPKHGIKPTDDVLAAIEKVMGREILFPNPFPDEIGVQTSRGVASFRAIHALYQAWRIRELVREISKPRVLELGGGLGRTAYYARQLGVMDYTIIDLPFTAFSQGYFLMRTLGEDQVVLQGEHEVDALGKVKLFNPSAFLEGSQRYDLVVNVDSLTEMDRSTAEQYWNRIQTAAPAFLSINHESNLFTVKELIDGSRARVAIVHRHPYGIRRGYAEELVYIRS